MTDEEALRAAVLAHPDDDTPRLVYADWCDDAGHADRAAFIRAQIEAVRAEPWSPAARAAEERAAALRDQEVFEWSQTAGVPFRVPEFVRGFVEGVEQYPVDLPSGFTSLLRHNPIRRLTLAAGIDAHDDPDRLAELFDYPELASITGLDLRAFECSNPFVFDAVLRAEGLGRLAELNLANRFVQPQWIQEALQSPVLPSLTALDVSDIPNLGPALAAGLQGAPHRRFTRLNVAGVRFLSGELKRVLGSRALSEVQELRLGWPFPGPGPLTMLQLGWVMPWARLRLLDLAGQQLGPDGVKEITREREAAGLRWLGLARNHLGTAGAEWLLESPHLNLYHLDVSDNGIPPQLLAALRARFPDALVVG